MAPGGLDCDPALEHLTPASARWYSVALGTHCPKAKAQKPGSQSRARGTSARLSVARIFSFCPWDGWDDWQDTKIIPTVVTHMRKPRVFRCLCAYRLLKLGRNCAIHFLDGDGDELLHVKSLDLC